MRERERHRQRNGQKAKSSREVKIDPRIERQRKEKPICIVLTKGRQADHNLDLHC